MTTEIPSGDHGENHGSGSDGTSRNSPSVTPSGSGPRAPDTSNETIPPKHKRRHDTFEWAGLILNGVLGLASIVAAGFAGWLALTTQRMFREGRDNAVRQFRAYVSAPALGQSAVYAYVSHVYGEKMHAVNVGATPAFSLAMGGLTEVLPYPPGPSVARVIHARQIPIQRADKTFFPGDPIGLNIVSKEHITADQYHALMTGQKKRIYSFGTINYRDTFGFSRWTHFCWSFSFNYDIPIPKTPTENLGSSTAEACPFWNDAN